MKIIDILNKIANKEEIGKFKIMGMEHYIDDDNFLCAEDGERVEWFIDDEWLNMPVEIIVENKKIEKIDVNHLQQIKKWKRAKILGNKINEIMDYLEEKE